MSSSYEVGAIVRGAKEGDVYRLVRRLGDGASAFVFEADDLCRGERVALKLLRNGASPARMQRESRALQNLRHPNIVRLLSFGVTRNVDRIPYLVMPLLVGAPLRTVLDAEGALGVERSVDYATELFLALAHAHAAGILHRDIRPDNLFLERLAPRVHRLVMFDFDLTCAPRPRVPTAQGLVGDPRYAAPELLYGGDPSFATDLYAAGLVLFEMLTGRHPLASTSDDWREVHATILPLPLHAVLPTAPLGLAALQASLLAKHARHRPTSAETCANALCAVQEQSLVPGPNSTTEDGVDSLLRCLAGPTAEEVTQVEPPPPSLLRQASDPDDTIECPPPSSSSWPISG